MTAPIPAWGRNVRETSEAQRSNRAPFRCDECGHIGWHSIETAIRGNAWPEHCSEMMAMLDGHEADEEECEP